MGVPPAPDRIETASKLFTLTDPASKIRGLQPAR